MVARTSTQSAAPLQRVADAVTERLVEEPVDDRVDGAVSVSEPERERQDASLSGVEVEINPQRDHVIRQPAGNEHDDDRHQQSYHRATAAVDGVAVRSRRRDVVQSGSCRVTTVHHGADGDRAAVAVGRRRAAAASVPGSRVPRHEQGCGCLLPAAAARAAAAAADGHLQP